MALRDIFKKRLKEKPIGKVKPVETTTQPSVGPLLKEIKVEKPSEIITQKVKKEMKIGKAPAPKFGGEGEAWKILKGPHVTEKATALSEKNKYVFKIYPGVNKIEIKKAIEDLYGVNVIDVKIINISRKKRRLGKISGWRKGYKKAIVKIKEGQKIEVLPR